MTAARAWEEDKKTFVSEKRLTICVVGSGGVGKSSLVIKYLHGHFPEIYDPTVEESYITKVEYGFDLHDVEIIDTAGQEEFAFFRDSSLSKGDAFLGLFEINSISSWCDLKQIRSKIIHENDDDIHIPIIIIANKCDLDGSREVNFEEVMEYCQVNKCPFLETSAKTGLNVTESFRLLLDRTADLKPKKFKNSILKPSQSEEVEKRNSCSIS